MGICLSCLRGVDDDDHSQLNENTPLLNDGQLDYDEGSMMRKREEELNTIVHETSENLIDITSFFNPSNSVQDLSLKKSVATLKNEGTPPSSTDSEAQPRRSAAKLIPNEYVSTEEKSILKELNKTLFELVEKATAIESTGPLVATFE